ncbi:MAG: Alpha-aminoadipate--lysW ligase lysX, partial [Bacteroidota bacterium]
TFFKLNQPVILQEFIEEAAGSDVRAFVVGREVVAAMRRQAPPGEFRSNLHRGAMAEPVELSEAEEKMVLRAARLMGLEVAGVDLLRSRRGPLVMEVNASPGLEGIEMCTGLDIAGKIISHLEAGHKSFSKKLQHG